MFKPGDWIIATKEFVYSTGVKDRSYMSEAMMITGIDENFITYLGWWSDKEYIMDMKQVMAREFIIAPDHVVNASKQHMPWIKTYSLGVRVDPRPGDGNPTAGDDEKTPVGNDTAV